MIQLPWTYLTEPHMRNKWFIIILLLASCTKAGKSPSLKSSTIGPHSNMTPPPPTSSSPVSAPDPLYAQSWHLQNTGQMTFSLNGGNVGQDLNIVTARNLGLTGLGVRIAVSDTGVETSHEDLALNLLPNEHRDYSKASAPFQGDPNTLGSGGDHGTGVIGIISALGLNGLGSQGVAYGAKIAAFKYINGSNRLSRMLDQASGDFDIFNYSYGLYSCIFSSVPSDYIAQLKFGVNNGRDGKGAIYIKAAGNEYVGSTSDCFPDEEDPGLYYGNANLEEDHSYPYQIVVGAINANGISASYSTPGSSLWISAAGGEYGDSDPAILTTDRTGCDRGYSQADSTKNSFESGSSQNPNCNYTSAFNGTSAATPMVSGVSALILEANPNLSWRDVKHIIASTAVKVDPNRSDTGHPNALNLSGHTYQQGWITNAAGYNFHNWYGFGSIDAGAASLMAQTYNSNWEVQKETDFSDDSGVLDLSIPDASTDGVTSSLNVSQDYFIEAIQIRLSVTHSFIGDLGVELTSPSGTKSILMNINSGIEGSAIVDEILLSNAFYGEASAGLWSLKIIDGAQQDLGNLTNWKINIIGH